MNTVKDNDAGSSFLRTLLQMNPAYGAFLSSDKDLASTVQLFAKKVKAKVQTSESPIRPTSLYEPLCEIAWRVVGLVLHCILEHEDPNVLPVPKQAKGQLRMLVQTNLELSQKLCDMRRAYLKELSWHRDRQRFLSEQATKAVAALHEYPVMFFEPLEFVLDASTKNFVREVVEERLKLDIKGLPPVAAKVVEEQEGDVAESTAELKALQSELRQLRNLTARQKEELDKFELRLKKQKMDFDAEREAARKLLADGSGEGAAMAAEMRRLQDLLNEKMALIEDLEDRLAKKEKELEEKPKEIRSSVPTMIEDSDLRSRLEAMQEAANRERQRLEEQLRMMQKENAMQAQKLEKLANADPKVKELISKTEIQTSVRKQGMDDEDFQAQLKKHLQVEKELRDANRALEKALQEALDSKVGPKEKIVATSDDEAIRRAIQKVTAKFEKREKELEDELAELRAQLGSKKTKVKPEAPVDHSDDNKDMKWRLKFEDLEEKHDALQTEYEKLEHHTRLLMKKLEELGGKEAVQETLLKIKLSAPPVKKKRKEKAYERLYRDAQRRIIAMRMKQEEVRLLEEKALRSFARRIMNTKSLRMVENLTHLHKASVATTNRFHDALASFNDKHPELDTTAAGEEESGTDDDAARPWSRREQSLKAELEGYRAANLALVEEVEDMKTLLQASGLGRMHLARYAAVPRHIENHKYLEAHGILPPMPLFPDVSNLRAPPLSSAPVFGALSSKTLPSGGSALKRNINDGFSATLASSLGSAAASMLRRPDAHFLGDSMRSVGHGISLRSLEPHSWSPQASPMAATSSPAIGAKRAATPTMRLGDSLVVDRVDPSSKLLLAPHFGSTLRLTVNTAFVPAAAKTHVAVFARRREESPDKFEASLDSTSAPTQPSRRLSRSLSDVGLVPPVSYVQPAPTAQFLVTPLRSQAALAAGVMVL